MRSIAIAWVGVLAVSYGVVWLHGCKPGAEARYAAELVACVDRSETLAESKACRERVNRAWGIDAGDGGR